MIQQCSARPSRRSAAAPAGSGRLQRVGAERPQPRPPRNPNSGGRRRGSTDPRLGPSVQLGEERQHARRRTPPGRRRFTTWSASSIVTLRAPRMPSGDQSRRSAACTAGRGRRSSRASARRSRRAARAAGGSSSSSPLSSIVSSWMLSNAISRILRAGLVRPCRAAPRSPAAGPRRARGRRPRSPPRSAPSRSLPPIVLLLEGLEAAETRAATGTSATTRSGCSSVKSIAIAPPMEHPTSDGQRLRRARRAAPRGLATWEYGSPGEPAGPPVAADVVPDHAVAGVERAPAPAGPRSASPRAPDGSASRPGPRRPSRSRAPLPAPRANRFARRSRVEPRLQPPIRLGEQLGQHARLAHDGHEVRVAAPPRHDVPVQVLGDPRAGRSVPRFSPTLNPCGSDASPERADRSLQQRLELGVLLGGRRPPGRRRGGAAPPGGAPGCTGTC